MTFVRTIHPNMEVKDDFVRPIYELAVMVGRPSSKEQIEQHNDRNN